VTVVAGYNDAFVMNAWSKAHGIKHDDILFVSDNDAAFSKSIGWNQGARAARYVIVIDHGKVTYAAKDRPGQLDVSIPYFIGERVRRGTANGRSQVSSAETVIAKL